MGPTESGQAISGARFRGGEVKSESTAWLNVMHVMLRLTNAKGAHPLEPVPRLCSFAFVRVNFVWYNE